MKERDETVRPGQEVEFKLGIRRSSAPAVADEVMRLSEAKREDLRSLYLDTPDDRLAKASISLRLREQSGCWVQTLKMRHGNGNRCRDESEVEVPSPEGSIPTLDLGRHSDTAAGKPEKPLLGASLRPARTTHLW